MRLEHYPLKKLKKEIVDIVSRHLDLREYRLFFFGSRVSGQGDDRSDIDIGIEGSRKVPWDVLCRIKADVSNIPTLYRIDIVDFCSVAADFKKVAKQYVEYIEIKKSKKLSYEPA